MIRRLTLVDFMAHGRTVIDLPPGLTALTGPNNSGKSAVVEALRCLTENPPPKHCIRHGAADLCRNVVTGGKGAKPRAEFGDQGVGRILAPVLAARSGVGDHGDSGHGVPLFRGQRRRTASGSGGGANFQRGRRR